jgi:hypothetical protein
VGGHFHTPAALLTGMSRWYPLYRRVGGPQFRPGRVRKNLPPKTEFDPRTVKPVTSCYIDYAISAHSRAVNTLNNATTLKKSSRWFYCVPNNGVYSWMNFKDTTFRKLVACPSNTNEGGKVNTPRITQLKNDKKFFKLAGNFPCRKENAVIRRWWKHTAGR